MVNAPLVLEGNIAFIQHVGWLRHDCGEVVVRLLQQGHFEASEQAFFWLYLRPGDTFVDCGAHIGLYSVLASNAMSDSARVIAVEANPDTAQHLMFNLKSNNATEAIVIEAAIWDSLGEICFLESENGEAAYDHVDFFNDGPGLAVTSITLDQIVKDLGGDSVALVKIDVEGAESEAIIGGRDAITAGLLPVLMVEFTDSNLRRRGLTTDQLYNQLADLGYTLCEFNPEQLQLEPFRSDGPIWYKNLFACKDLSQVNLRLESAGNANRKIALDILARGAVCSQFKALEDLERFKKLAEQSEYIREWAERTEQFLLQERVTSNQFKEWAERTEQFLLQERVTSNQFKEWAERTEQFLLQERVTSNQFKEWAERTEQFLLQERVTSNQFKEWAEGAEARFAKEQESNHQMRDVLMSRKKLFLRLLSRKLSND
jgi:FkbM family methyltransferase